MGIVYDVDQEEGITYVVWDGDVGAEQWLSHVQQLLSDPKWPTYQGLHLTDLRTCTLDSTIDEAVLEKAASLFARHPKISMVKTAILAHNAFQKALFYERLIRQVEPFVIVFHDLDTACTWLGVNLELTARALDSLRRRARGGTN
jgi:hypothetical protein